MDPQSAPEEVLSDAALNAAHEAASLRPLAVRVAELETELAVERAEHAGRLRQADGVARSLRHALQAARTELRHVKAERVDLLAGRDECLRQLAVLREREQASLERNGAAALIDDGATAQIVASAISRAQSADIELARLNRITEVLKARVRELEGDDGRSEIVEILEQLHGQLTERDAELVRAAEAIGELEQSVQDGEQRVRLAESKVAELRERLESAATEPRGQLGAPEPGSVVVRSGPWLARDREALSPTVASTRALTRSRTATGSGHGIYGAGQSEADGHELANPASAEPPALDDAASLAEDPRDDSGTYEDSGDASGLVLECDSGSGADVRDVEPSAAAPLGAAPAPSAPVLAGLDSDALDSDSDSDSDSVSAAVALGHVGVELPGFRVEREAARSSVYESWYARPHDGGRPVTVYLLNDAVADPDDASLGALERLRHPNLLPFLSYSADAGTRRLVYARPGGESADAWVSRVGQVSERIALAVAIQAARGLAVAADSGVHHGDLSPSSLWVDPSGGVRIAGIGLRALVAAVLPPDHVAYAAPEHRSAGSPSARGDMYALGAVLYFLLTGCAAIAVRADGSTGSGLPDPRSVHGQVSESAAIVVATLTATDPTARPPSWEAVIGDLEDVVAGRPLAPRPVPRSPGLLRQAFGRPHVIAALLAIPFALTAAILHVQEGFEPTPRESFDAIAVRAERLVRLGDVDGARRLYRKYTRDTGDPAVEVDARARLEALDGHD